MARKKKVPVQPEAEVFPIPKLEPWPLPDGVSKVNAAFPTMEFTPKWEQVPDDFKKSGFRGHRGQPNMDNEWVKLAHDLFCGIRSYDKIRLMPREGVSAEKAWWVVQDCLGAWASNQEHKEAAAGYLLWSYYECFWFDGDGSENDIAYRATFSMVEIEKA